MSLLLIVLLVLLRAEQLQQKRPYRGRDPLPSALPQPAGASEAHDQQAEHRDGGHQAQQDRGDDVCGDHRRTLVSTAWTRLDSSRGLNGLMM